MGQIFNIQTRKKGPITTAEYMGMLDTFELYCKILQEHWAKDVFKHTLEIVKEIRFCAYFSYEFRESTKGQMRKILDDMYILVNDITEN